MTLHFEGDDVREYIQMITLAEKYATQIEVIKRIVIKSQYDSEVREGVELVLGIKRGAKDDNAA